MVGIRILLTAAVALVCLVWPTPAAAVSAAVPPLDGPVVRRFDPPAQPWLAGHRGVDLRGEPGATVVAAMAGTVTYAGMLAGRGVVVVSHGSLRTTYLPVRASVTVGTRVAAGARIGTLAAGHSCPGGSCLHWGLKRGDVYLNPLSLLGTQLRLLPAPAPRQFGRFAGSTARAPAGDAAPSPLRWR